MQAVATELARELSRSTGLVIDDLPAEVGLEPSADGGSLFIEVRRGRGKRDRRSIPLSELAGRLFGTPDCNGDTVDAGALEARIMISADPGMSNAMRGALQRIVRDMREDARADAGLPPVSSMTDRRRKFREST